MRKGEGLSEEGVRVEEERVRVSASALGGSQLGNVNMEMEVG